ncbi:MAG: CoA ester lyase [Corynebacterium sp.]|uniref:HpcH/HpaI aldolase/citrate lyase family protein n=1 Tax=Corynebacterium sp. TaxID=1720 RepID=UPI0026E0F44B|nr:CoA ester lyase [Corynebacterium sp.]MDO5670236.1 CoA ester lyase [Corynebacterium sp.]
MSILHTARTALFTPANRPDRVRKALDGPADLVIIDLEDAVAPDSKDEARALLIDVLASPSPREIIIVRINDPSSSVGAADLEALQGRDVSVMIPKISASTPLPSGVPVIGLVETAAGVRDLHQIAALEGIERLALGAVDLSAELGCKSNSTTIDAIRAQLVVASAAAGLPAPLESPCVNFRDAEVVEAAAARAHRDGFGGMLCIHPAQLASVTAAFQPTADEIAWATRVLAAGEDASGLDGEMIDRPVLLRAQRILSASS